MCDSTRGALKVTVQGAPALLGRALQAIKQAQAYPEQMSSSCTSRSHHTTNTDSPFVFSPVIPIILEVCLIKVRQQVGNHL